MLPMPPSTRFCSPRFRPDGLGRTHLLIPIRPEDEAYFRIAMKSTLCRASRCCSSEIRQRVSALGCHSQFGLPQFPSASRSEMHRLARPLRRSNSHHAACSRGRPVICCRSRYGQHGKRCCAPFLSTRCDRRCRTGLRQLQAFGIRSMRSFLSIRAETHANLAERPRLLCNIFAELHQERLAGVRKASADL